MSTENVLCSMLLGKKKHIILIKHSRYMCVLQSYLAQERANIIIQVLMLQLQYNGVAIQPYISYSYKT